MAVTIVTGALAGCATANAQATDAQIESFSTRQVEISRRVADRFWSSGEGPRFFAAAGPFRGCDAYKSAISSVAGAHYPAFRPEIVAAYKDIVPASLLQQSFTNQAPHLAAYENRVSARLDQRASAIVDEATSEVTATLQIWLQAERLETASLGVNKQGKAFWSANPAGWRLICAMPTEEDRRLALGDWLDGAK